MSEELAARLMARIAVPPMPFAPDTYTAGRMDQFTEMITQLRALPEVDKEQVLADVKARIEDLHYGDDNLLIGTGYQLAVNDALAALTQPQTEKCPEDCDGFGQLIGDSDGPCPACSGLESDGGGAATPRGVADADLVRVGDFFGIPAFTHPDVKPGIVGIVSAGEVTAVIADREEPGPYAKAFRERVCPVPEFPGLESGYPDHVAPIPQTEGECPQCGGDGKGPLTHHFGEPCPTCSGTGKDKA